VFSNLASRAALGLHTHAESLQDSRGDSAALQAAAPSRSPGRRAPV
jgi:hypothetical protein